MSEQPSERQRHNLELARAGYEAFQRSDLDGVLALTDPEVEIYLPPTLPNSGTFRGHQGYITWIGQWLEAWEDFKIEVLAMEPVGEWHVVTTIHQTAVGRGSGIPVEMDIAYMSDIRDEKVVALQMYQTKEEAIRIARERESDADGDDG
jgi:ketosteroid isomerase-like protein